MADKDDLAITMTEGYNPGEKKTLDEYNKLDADDEALNRWKASLGLGQGKTIGDPSDPRKVIVEELALLVEGRPDIVVDLRSPGAVGTLKEKPFIIKEGASYHMRIKWRVQHEVISGLRYIQVVRRKSVKVDKSEEMMGSYGPNTESSPFYTKTFAEEEAPSGMLYRGSYHATSRFADDDNNTHLLFDWAFDIKKSWE